MPPKIPKPGKPLTREQRDAIDEKIFEDGGFEITRNDGSRWRMQGDGTFVPITGGKAQQIIKKQRKPASGRKPKKNG